MKTDSKQKRNGYKMTRGKVIFVPKKYSSLKILSMTSQLLKFTYYNV